MSDLDYTDEPDDGYREWLARQTPEVQRRQRDAREPAWDEMAADRAMARAEKRREREER